MCVCIRRDPFRLLPLGISLFWDTFQWQYICHSNLNVYTMKTSHPAKEMILLCGLTQRVIAFLAISRETRKKEQWCCRCCVSVFRLFDIYGPCYQSEVNWMEMFRFIRRSRSISSRPWDPRDLNALFVLASKREERWREAWFMENYRKRSPICWSWERGNFLECKLHSLERRNERTSELLKWRNVPWKCILGEFACDCIGT